MKKTVDFDKLDLSMKLDRGRGKTQPLYKQIQNHLKEQIKGGKIPVGSHLPSISEMVKRWNVDYQTINMALERLGEAGYLRRQPGRGKGPVVLRTMQHEHTIMFIRPNNDSLSLEITEGILKFTLEKGVEFIIQEAMNSDESYVHMLSHTIPNVEGIIVLPDEKPEYYKAVKDVLASGKKIVFVDRFLENIPVSSVTLDHKGGAFQATKHLLTRHGQPVYCFGLRPYSSSKARYEGWACAMREYHFIDVESYIIKDPTIDNCFSDDAQRDIDASTKIAYNFLSKSDSSRFSIFCPTGFEVVGIYQAADKLNLKIGRDVHVVGFGDHPLCRNLHTPLTSVLQKSEQVGYEAAHLLLMELNGLVSSPVKGMLPAQLQIHESSGIPLTAGGKSTSQFTYESRRQMSLAST
ncbi:HTH-type transcriptional repressor CytR [Limihaloglobus sulfuriphilus]|uniref:HTH-type transcriptional repressor CytR n=1 Tax=Limihaloglobus sulfuriphilus TaxID=1851148 RepID=A0A1Q2MEA5_9BACT|nr:GntR family transcriptional regulator [Limihaloglobus sulfuriphilus]AQQ71000.1 HTH-type transcriptional repressor CytR [Limihaloglobus sulfuriphilus]